MSKLKTEIEQRLPFSSLEEEALLNLLRTADACERGLQRITRAWGLTLAQYNVLRILRGAGAQGLTCSSIGRRMIAAEPDITRLLARLERNKLLLRRRDQLDKRVVWISISPLGLERLAHMDAVMDAAPAQLLTGLPPEELHRLIDLLERARLAAAPQKPSS